MNRFLYNIGKGIIMKRYIQIVAMLVFSILGNNLHAAATKEEIHIQTAMKYSFSYNITDDTTIRDIKNFIQGWEGIPVDQQVLYKEEWVRKGFVIPEKMKIELEENKTCREYDIRGWSYFTIVS